MSRPRPRVAMPIELAREGVTYRQLDYWSRQGWLQPGQPGSGSGHDRLWTPGEIQVGVRMARLVEAGLRHDVAAVVARTGRRATRLTDHVLVAVLEPTGPSGGLP